jgi:hypothetical protein
MDENGNNDYGNNDNHDDREEDNNNYNKDDDDSSHDNCNYAEITGIMIITTKTKTVTSILLN